MESATGVAMFLEMHALDTDRMEVFPAELARHYTDKPNVAVLEGSGVHTAHALVVPEYVVLLFVPPYARELNSVARRWLAIRWAIDVYDEAVRTRLEALCDEVGDCDCAIFDACGAAARTGCRSIL